MNQYETEHANIVRRLAAECTVLLKRDGKFPLSSVGKIALYGSGARHTIKGGTGSGEVNSRYFITVEEGLKKAGFEITTNPWLDAWDEIIMTARQSFIKEILRAEWGYRGIVMTDWVVAGVKQVQHPGYRNALSDCVAAAGGDLFMPGCRGDVQNIMKALKKGTLSRRQLKENATRVRRVAIKLTEAKND